MFARNAGCRVQEIVNDRVMDVSAILRPDPTLWVGEMLLIARQIVIPCRVQPVADVVQAVFVLGVGQRLGAWPRPVCGVLLMTAGPIRLGGRTRVPVGQPVEALAEALTRPRRRTIG